VREVFGFVFPSGSGIGFGQGSRGAVDPNLPSDPGSGLGENVAGQDAGAGLAQEAGRPSTRVSGAARFCLAGCRHLVEIIPKELDEALSKRAAAVLDLMICWIGRGRLFRDLEAASRAVAVILQQPTDQFYGDRTYSARDPEGHAWGLWPDRSIGLQREGREASGLNPGLILIPPLDRPLAALADPHRRRS